MSRRRLVTALMGLAILLPGAQVDAHAATCDVFVDDPTMTWILPPAWGRIVGSGQVVCPSNWLATTQVCIHQWMSSDTTVGRGCGSGTGFNGFATAQGTATCLQVPLWAYRTEAVAAGLGQAPGQATLVSAKSPYRLFSCFLLPPV